MQGTIVCAVTDGDEGGDVLAVGAELSQRLGLRLVVAHTIESIDAVGDGDESVTMRANRHGAERRLAQLMRDHGIADRAERRVAAGDPAALVGRIAAEEAADVIVVGSRARGWRRRLESPLVAELAAETPVPVLIAPPRAAMSGGGS